MRHTEQDEKRAIRLAFDAAVDSYDAVADIQRQVASALFRHLPERLDGLFLDAGCGTGHGTRLLEAGFSQAQIIGLDAALGMCRTGTRGSVICADIEALPLRTGSLALYWSSLAWQWTRPLEAATEAFRTLAPDGVLRVATLGPGTMHELRSSFGKADSFSHVRSFDTPEYHAEALQQAGFREIRLYRENLCGFFPDLPCLLRSIRRLGAHVITERRRGLFGRQAWSSLSTAYETFRTEEGLPVSHDVIYLIAQKE